MAGIWKSHWNLAKKCLNFCKNEKTWIFDIFSWKITVNRPVFLQFCPPMAYFWWKLDGIANLYPLAAFCTKKNGFLGPKGENFEIFKIFDPAHFWGSGGLIMLPQGQEDVCEQRGPPDDDFEYWTAFVPRRGAEIWAAKVFWRKTKNSRKCIFIIWVQPDVFIFTKMVLRGTNWSHMKTFITVGHFGGIWQEKTHFEPKISQKYIRKRPKSGKPRQALFRAHFIVQIAIGGS